MLYTLEELAKVTSPCTNCYIRGHKFSHEDEYCQKCEYYISVLTLKYILKVNDCCMHCANIIVLGGGYFGCKLQKEPAECSTIKDFSIDWISILNEYNLIKKGDCTDDSKKDLPSV